MGFGKLFNLAADKTMHHLMSCFTKVILFSPLAINSWLIQVFHQGKSKAMVYHADTV